ncbi:hypothetical protein Droror1_Dr00009445 [Drosera rotundifolia]
MNAESGLMMYSFPHNFSHELHQLQQLCLSHEPSSSMGNISEPSIVSEYDLGGEGDLFKAPEPIIQEPVIGIDPLEVAAISLMFCGDDMIPAGALEDGDMEPLQSGQLLSDAFYECKKDILEKTAVEAADCQVQTTKVPALPVETEIDNKLKSPSDFPLQTSVSLGCFTVTDLAAKTASSKPSFLDFSVLNIGTAYGMSSFDRGEIETLGNGDICLIHSHIQRPLLTGSCTAEDRLEKLSRYKNKKSRRNFGRKLKYACRKVLADSQPRIHGRFARTEDTDVCRK